MNRTALVLVLLLAVIVSARFIDAQTQPVAGLVSTAVVTGPTGPPSLFANGNVGAPSISFTSDPTTGFYRAGANIVSLSLAGANSFWLTNAALGLRSNTIIGWSSTTDASLTPDTGLSRNAAGVIEINNGTGGQRASLTTNNGGAIIHGAVTFATLNVNVANGTQVFCSDCAAGAIDVTCTGGGTGAMAFRINGVWRCLS